MKKNMRYALASFLAIVLVMAIIILLNPLRRSEEQIRKNLLKLTPIGTSMEDVISVIEDRKWEYDMYDHGYLFMHQLPSRHIPRNDDTAVGVKTIEAYLGEYRTIFATDVSVFYGFDEKSKLIDIAVLKEVNAL